MQRTWAFWRRVQYGTGFGVFCMLLISLVYFTQFYTPANCFDGRQNGTETGTDCGGDCVRICAVDVIAPTVDWARSFAVAEGVYNAVGYVENRNPAAASPAVPYTLSLYDESGLITSRNGETILPPDSVYPVFEARIDTGGRVPTQTILELGNAAVWVPSEAGREQFTVNSRTLTGVDLRPRLEADIYNNALTEAEDVEVVATIFDARGNALTASRTFIDRFTPRSETTAVFTWPQPIAKTVRSCEVPTDVAVAIDLSGSMNNDGGTPPEPISSVLTAAEAFTKRLRANDQAALITFATDAIVANQLTGDTGQVATAISQLAIDPEEERGSTNTGDALLRAGAELNSARHSNDARKVLVLLTDGLATAPDEEPEAYALQAAQQVKADDVIVYTIGLGSEVNMSFLQEVASSPAQAYAALSTSDIDRIYQTITGALCEDGPAVIEIIPKTTAGFVNL